MNRAALLASLALAGGGLWVYSRRAHPAIAGDASSSVGGELVSDAYVGFYDLLGGLGVGLRLSAEGLEALKRSEGFSATPYPDFRGWSIGYGHLIKPGESLARVSELEAAELLARDVADAEAAVNGLVAVPLSQSQFDALVSFAYNVGRPQFRSSTLLARLNAGNYAAVPAQLARWVYVTENGAKRESAALVRRRAEEAQRFSA